MTVFASRGRTAPSCTRPDSSIATHTAAEHVLLLSLDVSSSACPPSRASTSARLGVGPHAPELEMSSPNAHGPSSAPKIVLSEGVWVVTSAVSQLSRNCRTACSKFACSVQSSWTVTWVRLLAGSARKPLSTAVPVQPETPYPLLHPAS